MVYNRPRCRKIVSREVAVAKRAQIFKCEVCGHIVEILHSGKGTLVCCNQPMKLYEENVIDAAVEKHVPVVEEVEGGIRVKVGSSPHPMESKHYIEWIEVLSGTEVWRRHLHPGESPEAEFHVDPAAEFTVRAYCNIHGLWRG